MLDINKYLEAQNALAQQKNKIIEKRDIVSEKSRFTAEIISKRQEKHTKLLHSKEESNSKSLNINKDEDSDDGSIYVSSDDDEFDVKLPSVPSTSRSRQELTKVYDDGDTELYNERISVWKNNVVAAKNSNTGCLYSADIQYILNGHKDFEDNHELQNGFVVPKFIWKQLYKYQRTGVKWLWELHQTQSGGLLGDEMGLGKTVQIIAFLAGLSKTDCGTWGGLGPSIIVAPATVIYQWVSHFHFWYPSLRVAVLHHSGSHAGKHNKLIRNLHTSHGILLITYAGIVKYAKDMLPFKWHYIILDEGHKIRNPDTQVSKTVKQFKTPHKLIITGSPMQNSLQELWSLFDFMRPGLLGTYNAFMEYFAQPITQGGYANASEFQEATALKIAKALKNIITPYMLRRTKAEVQDHIKLPDKNEQVLFCALSQEQRDLYMGYLMSGTVRSILDKESRFGDPLRARVLVALSTLRKICNHPDLYLYEAQEESTEYDDNFGFWKRCGKMTVVYSLLKIWQKQGHRALIFTQSRAMLCILEQFLLVHNYKYLKMDGSVSVSQRQNLIKTFNENKDYLVFLATTRVGGLGVNLTGADRVIIYDPDWNPAIDTQAKERAWRIGQQRDVTVYRLLSAGTIEEKIYQRQIFKHFLSNKVLLDPNQKNVLTTSTLQGLFRYEEPNHEGDTETASLFKHTKINLNNTRQKYDKKNLSLNIRTNSKLQAMRKMAKEISKKISMEAKNLIVNPKLDPRERFKEKRKLLLNPPKEEKPQVNLIDDKETNVPFESVLSELEIINLHTKKDYEKKLLDEVISSKEKQTEGCEITEDDSNNTKSDEVNECNNCEPKEELSPESLSDECQSTQNNSKKRKYSEIENLVAIKKVKRRKNKQNKEKETDDDYVLGKLFAKAGVKNALQHDVVVGLAEKEKMHKIKEEASKKARDAVRALRSSCKRLD